MLLLWALETENIKLHFATPRDAGVELGQVKLPPQNRVLSLQLLTG